MKKIETETEWTKLRRDYLVSKTATTSSSVSVRVPVKGEEHSDKLIDILYDDVTTEKEFDKNPINHILYEFLMYLETSDCISNDQFINNMIVDSRMVHLRNLAYFFGVKFQKNEKYLNYASFIEEKLPEEISPDLNGTIQDITSNSTCHLQKGRYTVDYRKRAIDLQQEMLPTFARLIKSFIEKANIKISEVFIEQWKDARVQTLASYILNLANDIEARLSEN